MIKQSYSCLLNCVILKHNNTAEAGRKYGRENYMFIMWTVMNCHI